MKLDTIKLHGDILKKLGKINKPQSHLSTNANVSRSTLDRLNRKGRITMETFLKLLKWLDKNANSYIK